MTSIYFIFVVFKHTLVLHFCRESESMRQLERLLYTNFKLRYPMNVCIQFNTLVLHQMDVLIEQHYTLIK